MKDFEPNRHGPDAFLELVFAPAEDARVRAWVSDLGLPRFVGPRRMPGPMAGEFASLAVPDYEVWADEGHAEAVFGNLDGTHRTNVWIYALVSIGGGRVWFEHGYSCAYPWLIASEMRLLASLCGSGVPGMTAWSIRYGGQGYGGGTIRAECDAVELRSYLGI